MSDPYPHSDWYDQTLTEPPADPGPPGRRKKDSGKRAALAVCALVLVVACVYALADRPRRTSLPAQEPSSAAEEHERDYRAFFAEYYIGAETKERSLVRREAGDPNVVVSLVSAEGREDLRLSELYRQSAASIVGVKGGFSDRGGYTWGTGVVLSADGYILTNQHIFAGASTASVVLPDGTEWDAALIGEDFQTDLAVLRIDLDGLAPAEFGDSAALSIGDRVAAIGNPMGTYLSQTMTDGIISGVDRSVNVGGRQMTLLQTNAAINEGSSGGPLLNMYGQVVGVTNMKLANPYIGSVPIEGLGFAIPSATIKTVADQLIAHGAVLGRPSLGLTLGEIPAAVAEYYGLPKGLYVYSVDADSDAARQGVRTGDILLRLDGQEVGTTDEVLSLRDAHAVGDTVKLTVWRDGDTLECSVTLYDQSEL